MEKINGKTREELIEAFRNAINKKREWEEQTKIEFAKISIRWNWKLTA